ncbi:MAG: glutamine synthetase [Candidatus Aenigmarchaeota archaeon]|nr:glutamine synthetase [Candidatus Aenigmarchaeota archaeon]
MKNEEVKKILEKVDFIELGIVNVLGQLKTRTFLNKNVDEILEYGFGFDGSSVGMARIEDSDLVALPDMSTLRVFDAGGYIIGFMLCNVFKREKPFMADPRNLLKSFLEKYPYTSYLGPEIEFYIIRENKQNGNYMDPYPVDVFKPLKRELLLKLDSLGFDVKLEHHEVGQDQHEITIRYDNPLTMADKIIFYKYFLRSFFKDKGFDITFMPKPFFGMAGNGMHCHISVWENGKNLFENGTSLSEEGMSFIAGLMEHAQEMTLLTNFTVNSYKRLVPGYEAPCYVSWGFGNRSAMIRVPSYRNKVSTIELRSPDPLVNPYLAFLSILSAGLDGIEKGLKPSSPINFNLFKTPRVEDIEVLPSTLEQAISNFIKGKLLKKVLGDVASSIVELKKNEWDSYISHLSQIEKPTDTLEITEWEKKMYFYM